MPKSHYTQVSLEATPSSLYISLCSTIMALW